MLKKQIRRQDLGWAAVGGYIIGANFEAFAHGGDWWNLAGSLLGSLVIALAFVSLRD